MTLALTVAKKFINIIPDAIHSRASAGACNLLLKGQKFSKRLSDLDQKRLRITVEDTGTSLNFIFDRNRLVFDPKPTSSDIHIRGSLANLTQLALGDEDPDTLFFSRQLDIEGRTEDALILKNFLHSVEFDSLVHLQAMLGISVAKRLHPVVEKLQLGKHLHRLVARLSSEQPIH